MGRKPAETYVLDESSAVKGGFAQVYAATHGKKRFAVKVYWIDSVACAVDSSTKGRRKRLLPDIRPKSMRNGGSMGGQMLPSGTDGGECRYSRGNGRKQVRVDQVIEELRVMAKVQGSDYVVRLQDAFQLSEDSSKVWIVMEYLYGSLEEIMGRSRSEEQPQSIQLHDSQKPSAVSPPRSSKEAHVLDTTNLLNEMDLEDVAVVAQAVVSALEFIHQKGVAHLDIKPANIMFSDQGDVKLCDFGSAVIMNELYDYSEMPESTAGYMAPEVLKSGASYGRSADLFSLGVVVYEMFAATLPWSVTEFSPCFGKAEENAFSESDEAYEAHLFNNAAKRLADCKETEESIEELKAFIMRTIVPLYDENDLDDIERDSMLRRATAAELQRLRLVSRVPSAQKERRAAVVGVIYKYQHL